MRRWRAATRYRHRVFFVGSDVRDLAASGRLDYVPICLEEVPRLLASGRLPIDVALLQVSPPDARGFVSLGSRSISLPRSSALPGTSSPRSTPRCRAPMATASSTSTASTHS